MDLLHATIDEFAVEGFTLQGTFATGVRLQIGGNNDQIVDQCRLSLRRCNVGRGYVARAAS
jgi:hypothetical protein